MINFKWNLKKLIFFLFVANVQLIIGSKFFEVYQNVIIISFKYIYIYIYISSPTYHT
jgi:hypothetical protein